MWNPEKSKFCLRIPTKQLYPLTCGKMYSLCGKKKRKPTRPGKTNIFSGVAHYADCGAKLYYCSSKGFEIRRDYFVCYTSRKERKEVCLTHFIRAVVLEEIVLLHLQYVISYVKAYEDIFREKMER